MHQALPHGGDPRAPRHRPHHRGALHRLRQLHPRLPAQSEESGVRRLRTPQGIRIHDCASRAVPVRPVPQSDRCQRRADGVPAHRVRPRGRSVAGGGARFEHYEAHAGKRSGPAQAAHLVSLPGVRAADLPALPKADTAHLQSERPVRNRGRSRPERSGRTHRFAAGKNRHILHHPVPRQSQRRPGARRPLRAGRRRVLLHFRHL